MTEHYWMNSNYRMLLRNMRLPLDTYSFTVIPIGIFTTLLNALTVDKSLTAGVKKVLTYDPESSKYIACDNTANEFFVEEFDTYSESAAWLAFGDKEDDDT